MEAHVIMKVYKYPHMQAILAIRRVREADLDEGTGVTARLSSGWKCSSRLSLTSRMPSWTSSSVRFVSVSKIIPAYNTSNQYSEIWIRTYDHTFVRRNLHHHFRNRVEERRQEHVERTLRILLLK